jgi:hypothetical protein
LGGAALAGGEFVRFIYTDEAGTSAKEPVCVVASVIVHGDKQWRTLQGEIGRIVSERVPVDLRDNFNIHATEVFSGGKKINRQHWSFEERLDFLKEIICLPFIHDAPIALGVSFKREDWTALIDLKQLKLNNNKYAHFLAFARCMERSDLFLRKYLNGEEVGTVIAEDVPEIKTFLSRFGLFYREFPTVVVNEHLVPEAWQVELGLKPDDTFHEIRHIVDTPHFVEKGRAPLLQLADVCAFAFRHFLSTKDHGRDLVLAMLGPEQGFAFVNDDAWFSDGSGGLFNTHSYWSDDQLLEKERINGSLMMRRLSSQKAFSSVS